MPEQNVRSGLDRRSGNDRRLPFGSVVPSDRETFIMRSKERRHPEERRTGWVKVSNWHSADIGIPLEELKAVLQ